MSERLRRKESARITHKQQLPNTKTTPDATTPESHILQMQSLLGNKAVQRMLTNGELASGLVLQAKMEVGPSDDHYEREADAVADKVVNGADSSIQREDMEEEEMQMSRLQRADMEEEEMQMSRLQRADMEEEEMQMSRVQREGEEEEMQMSRLQRSSKGDDGFTASNDVEAAIQSKKGGGQNMGKDSLSFFESRMGYDFSNVNIHTDSDSDTLNRSLQSRAFTTGKDIFFRAGEYNPGTQDGQKLLAHELTHVVQQGSAGIKKKDETRR